jgi:hypothetical protein
MLVNEIKDLINHLEDLLDLFTILVIYEFDSKLQLIKIAQNLISISGFLSKVILLINDLLT